MKVVNIIEKIILGIMAFLAFLLVVIEGRGLFSGEWVIYDSFISGFLKYFCKFLLALIFVLIGIIEMTNLKNISFLKDNLRAVEIGLVLDGILIVIFSTNYLNLVVLVVITLFILIKVVKEILIYKKKSL